MVAHVVCPREMSPDRPLVMGRDGVFRFSHRLGFFGDGRGVCSRVWGALIAAVPSIRCDLVRDFGVTSRSNDMLKK